MKKGIKLPEGCYCPKDTCEPLSQIISTEDGSFFTVCKRINYKPENDRESDDKYVVRFRNDEIDEFNHYDKRDLIDTASVLMQAVSIIENEECN